MTSDPQSATFGVAENCALENRTRSHMEGMAEVYLYPGELCTPPVTTPFFETQKMFIREV
ncbi:MAG: hypothetical protein AAB545_01280 [Patescibacteria group bacterium]